MIAWSDKKKRVKMSKMMKQTVACAKIQVSVTTGDRQKIKSFKADILRQKTKIVKSFSEAALNFLKRINILTEMRRPDGRSILEDGTDVGRKCSSMLHSIQNTIFFAYLIYASLHSI